jgi:hypothetical protein
MEDTNTDEPQQRQSIATPGYPDPTLSQGKPLIRTPKNSWRHYLPAAIAAAVLIIALIIVWDIFIASK